MHCTMQEQSSMFYFRPHETQNRSSKVNIFLWDKKWKCQYTYSSSEDFFFPCTFLDHYTLPSLFLRCSFHSISLAQMCRLSVLCWQCPAAFHQRNDSPDRCCLIGLSVDYSLFQSFPNVLGTQRKMFVMYQLTDTWDNYHEEKAKEEMSYKLCFLIGIRVQPT